MATNEPPPQKGLEISTTGTVSATLTIGDRTFGPVINETKRGQILF